jgi:hypothetical protein
MCIAKLSGRSRLTFIDDQSYNTPYKEETLPFMWGVLDATLSDKVCQWLAGGR